MAAPNFIQSKDRTLKVVNQFLSASHIKDSSKARYRNALQVFLRFLKESNFKQITPEVIESYKNFLEKRLKPKTICFYLCALRRFFKYTEASGLHPDVASKVKNPYIEKTLRLRDDLSIGKIKKLLSAIPKRTLQGMRDRAIIQTMLRTGIKCCELVKATFRDLEWSDEANEQLLWIGPKGSSNFVQLIGDTLKPILAYIKEREAVRPLKNPDEPIFASLSDRNYGRPLTIYSVSRLVKNYMRKARIRSVNGSAASLRHTFALLAIKSGCSPFELSSAMRYKSDGICTYLRDLELEEAKRDNRLVQKKVNKLLGRANIESER